MMTFEDAVEVFAKYLSMQTEKFPNAAREIADATQAFRAQGEKVAAMDSHLLELHARITALEKPK